MITEYLLNSLEVIDILYKEYPEVLDKILDDIDLSDDAFKLSVDNCKKEIDKSIEVLKQNS